FGAEPEITASDAAVIHQETSPSPIGTVGTPNLVAAPSRSLFQTDTIGIRLILRATWALRAPGAVAWIANTTWGFMDHRIKRAILEWRLAGLRGHIETVGTSPGFERELAKAEAELREAEQRQPRG